MVEYLSFCCIPFGITILQWSETLHCIRKFIISLWRSKAIYKGMDDCWIVYFWNIDFLPWFAVSIACFLLSYLNFQVYLQICRIRMYSSGIIKKQFLRLIFHQYLNFTSLFTSLCFSVIKNIWLVEVDKSWNYKNRTWNFISFRSYIIM